MKNYVILAVSNDDLELPIAMFLNYQEMMKYTGKTLNSCQCAVCRGTIDPKRKCRYIKINLKGE